MAVQKSFTVNLDSKRSTSNREFDVVDGDNGNIILINLTDDGVAVDLTGCLVMVVFSKPDGSTAEQDSNGHGVTVLGTNQIQVALYLSSVSPGLVESEVLVFSDTNMDTLITSARFNFSCRRGIANEKTLSETDEWPILVGLIKEVEDGESERTANEATRVQSETARVNAENTRVSNELNRQTAEAQRQSNETWRQNNEDSRIDRDQAFGVWETYVPGKSYYPLNKVVYDGSSYICIAYTNLPPGNVEYWLMIAEKGLDAGVIIEGHYDTLSDLQAAVPNPVLGVNYEVGTTTPYDRYTYGYENGVLGWYNAGPLAESSEITESTPTDFTGLLAGENGLVVEKPVAALLPPGGTTGQFFMKQGPEDYNGDWGNAPVSSVNGKTGSVVLTAPDVGAVQIGTSNVTYYVALTGNDNNPGTSASPMRTIQAAINRLPLYSNYARTIYVQPGDYTGDGPINVLGLKGGARVIISAFTVTDLTETEKYVIRNMNISNCDWVLVRGLKTAYSQNYTGNFNVFNTLNAVFEFCTASYSGNAPYGYGFASERSNIYVDRCSVTGMYSNFISRHLGQTSIISCSSNNSTYTHFDAAGGITRILNALTTTGTGALRAISFGGLMIMPSGAELGS